MLAHVSFILSQITRLTDGKTEGGTHSFLVARQRCMQCMQRRKYVKKSFSFTCMRQNSNRTVLSSAERKLDEMLHILKIVSFSIGRYLASPCLHSSISLVDSRCWKMNPPATAYRHTASTRATYVRTMMKRYEHVYTYVSK